MLLFLEELSAPGAAGNAILPLVKGRQGWVLKALVSPWSL